MYIRPVNESSVISLSLTQALYQFDIDVKTCVITSNYNNCIDVQRWLTD